jgi:hypothetical protein
MAMPERPTWNTCIPNPIHLLESILNTLLKPAKSDDGMLNLWQLAFQLINSV